MHDMVIGMPSIKLLKIMIGSSERVFQRLPHSMVTLREQNWGYDLMMSGMWRCHTYLWKIYKEISYSINNENFKDGQLIEVILVYCHNRTTWATDMCDDNISSRSMQPRDERMALVEQTFFQFNVYFVDPHVGY